MLPSVYVQQWRGPFSAIRILGDTAVRESNFQAR
jgi:hypothetical protein